MLHVRTHTRCRSLRNTNSVCTPRRAAPRRAARHGTAGTPHQATPRHAMPLRKAHLTLPAGPADADADADSDAATAAARCLYRECTHVRVRTHRREVGYKTLSVRYSIYLCRLRTINGRNAGGMSEVTSVLIYHYQKEESILRMSLEIRIYLTARHERTRLLSNM